MSNLPQNLSLKWTVIIADASYCPKSRAAGYGYHISSTSGKETGGSVLPIDPECSLNAEMLGMIEALRVAVAKGIVDHNIILQCDCLVAWDYLCGIRTAKPDSERQTLCFEYLNLIRLNRLSVEFRHVKGHTTEEVQDPRNAMNRKCDEIAKFYMHQRRRELGVKYHGPKKTKRDRKREERRIQRRHGRSAR